MKRLFSIGLPVVAIGLLLMAIYHVLHAEQPTPQLPPPALPARAPFSSAIAASGITESQTENIALGAALSGIVLEVFVPAEKVGAKVAAGDPLFRVDDRHLKAQRQMAEAKLAAAQAQLARLDAQPRPEELPPSQARVQSAEANAARVQDDFKRLESLYKRGVASEQEFVTARLNYQAARHDVAKAEAELRLLKAGAWEADKSIARAAIAEAAAQLQQIETELDRTLVRAPVDGQVLQVNVRVGEFVSAQASQTLVMLGNLGRFRVRAEVDENDISRFDPKARAVASVRGNAAHTFPLQFVRVEPYVIAKRSLTGDNTERIDTRVMQVIYEIEKPEEKLLVGQQVDVFIEQR